MNKLKIKSRIVGYLLLTIVFAVSSTGKIEAAGVVDSENDVFGDVEARGGSNPGGTQGTITGFVEAQNTGNKPGKLNCHKCLIYLVQEKNPETLKYLTKTDDEGRFSVSLDEGSYELKITKDPTHYSQYVSITVEKNKTRSPLINTLEKKSCQLFPDAPESTDTEVTCDINPADDQMSEPDSKVEPDKSRDTEKSSKPDTRSIERIDKAFMNPLDMRTDLEITPPVKP